MLTFKQKHHISTIYMLGLKYLHKNEDELLEKEYKSQRSAGGNSLR